MTKTKETRAHGNVDLKRDEQNESRRDDQRNQAMQPRRHHEMQRPSSPFGLMRRFNEEMEHLFQDFGFGHGFPEALSGRDIRMFGGSSGWSPQIEVIERKGELCVRADLPGMSKNDVEIDIAENALILRGERRDDREQEEEGYYHSERSYGSFYRTIPLPDGVEVENAEATFSDGVLEITIPVPEQTGRRRIEIGERRKDQPHTQTKAAGQ